jgi:hypothetical protein
MGIVPLFYPFLDVESNSLTLLPEGLTVFDLQTRKHVAENRDIRVNNLYKVIVQKLRSRSSLSRFIPDLKWIKHVLTT